MVVAGGGGDSTPTPAAVTPSGNLNGTAGCTIALGESSCHPTITWVSQGPNPNVKLSIPATGSLSVNAFAASGTNTAMTIGAATSTVTLTSNTTVLAEVTIQGNCAADALFNGGVCVARRVPLASAAVLTSEGGYVPQVIHVYADGSHETLKPLLDIGYLIGNCVIRREVQAVSQPLNCVDSAGLRHNLSWIKTTNKIVAYDGTSGTLPALVYDPSETSYWLDVSSPDLVNGWNRAYAQAAGIFFAKSDRRFLWFLPAGSTSEAVVSGDIGDIKALTGF